MHRRDMNRLLIGGGALASGIASPLPGLGFIKDDKGPREITAGRVILTILTAQVALTWLLVHSQRSIVGWDLRQAMPQFSEARSPLGEKLFGALARPTIGTRLLEASFLGTLVLLGTVLILLRKQGAPEPARKAVATHRDLSWDLPGKSKPVRMGNLPSLPELRKLPVVGSAFLTGEARNKPETLFMIKPAIVNIPEG